MRKNPHNDFIQQKRQQQIQVALKNNQYTLVQMNSVEFIEFMFHIQSLKGKNQAQTIEWVDQTLLKRQTSPKEWEKYIVFEN